MIQQGDENLRNLMIQDLVDDPAEHYSRGDFIHHRTFLWIPSEVSYQMESSFLTLFTACVKRQEIVNNFADLKLSSELFQLQRPQMGQMCEKDSGISCICPFKDSLNCCTVYIMYILHCESNRAKLAAAPRFLHL